ncbi:hypothetical protein GGS26DRAFT_593687 [Hypomontagnella submonticulosa]|nr:hypothetical protein GGS26DRAFT_593687 [Hypomontagnella submonticulosa]
MDYATYSHFLPMNPAHIRPSAASSRRQSFQHGATASGQPTSSSSFVNGNHRHEEHAQQQQRMAADQAYKATFASHERAVFQEEVRARARRRDAARNKALFRGPIYMRPEFYAVSLGFLGILYPIVNQYVVQPWLEGMKEAR